MVDFEDILQFLVVFQLVHDFVLTMDNYLNNFHPFQEESLQNNERINLHMLNDFQQNMSHHYHIICLKLQDFVNV